MFRLPVPPFDAETAAIKTRLAEDAWNSRDPEKVALAYTSGSQWRNRETFVQGREEIVDFLTRKWAREHEYRLIKEVWAFRENRIAVRLPMSGMTGRSSGSALTAMRTGSSTKTA